MGIADQTKKGWLFRVHPTLVSHSNPLANVRNEYNAISLQGNAADDVLLYGKGAGKNPTSSAVLSDIMFLCRQIANGTAGRLPYVISNPHSRIKLIKIDFLKSRYYLRIMTADRPGILSKITGILGRNNVSLASVHQALFDNGSHKKGVPVILVTHKSLESNIQRALKSIHQLSSTLSKPILIRMED